jgi:hypothetical protein
MAFGSKNERTSAAAKPPIRKGMPIGTNGNALQPSLRGRFMLFRSELFGAKFDVKRNTRQNIFYFKKIIRIKFNKNPTTIDVKPQFGTGSQSRMIFSLAHILSQKALCFNGGFRYSCGRKKHVNVGDGGGNWVGKVEANVKRKGWIRIQSWENGTSGK